MSLSAAKSAVGQIGSERQLREAERAGLEAVAKGNELRGLPAEQNVGSVCSACGPS